MLTRFFTPFRQRLPGWWWSLDRPGDVARSARSALLCGLLGLTTVWLAAALIDSVVVVERSTHLVLLPGSSTPTEIGDEIYSIGFMGYPRDAHIDIDFVMARQGARFQTVRRSVQWQPGGLVYKIGIVLSMWLISGWACPACLGIMSQIRRGLPKHARAPSTIVAAANYESHRMIHAGILILLGCVVAVILRLLDIGQPNLALRLCAGVVVAVTAFGWVGPLRSDYTHQLIRSSWHSSRIILMYAVLFPYLFAYSAALVLAS
jgi:hypothetical protein